METEIKDAQILVDVYGMDEKDIDDFLQYSNEAWLVKINRRFGGYEKSNVGRIYQR